MKGFLCGWCAACGKNNFDAYTRAKINILGLSLLYQSFGWYVELTCIFLTEMKYKKAIVNKILWPCIELWYNILQAIHEPFDLRIYVTD